MVLIQFPLNSPFAVWNHINVMLIIMKSIQCMIMMFTRSYLLVSGISLYWHNTRNSPFLLLSIKYHVIYYRRVLVNLGVLETLSRAQVTSRWPSKFWFISKTLTTFNKWCCFGLTCLKTMRDLTEWRVLNRIRIRLRIPKWPPVRY